ncbi:MAG: UDP-glucose/GDP-mannose dehydrogenase family protein [Candidatus Aminicenantes bacterium]|nr:UDP-glucose/GDP-mannose dehydrogenase family protein [Candidatus Aminicenantes bacterium]
MKIGIIGTGYVGLVTAVGLAELGHQVIATDKDINKIKKLEQGIIPIYEPGLEELFSKVRAKGLISFTPDLSAAIRAADVIFVCVGTPPTADGSADMSQIEEVARKIAENLNNYKLIVEKSTVPVKTSYWIKRTINLYKKTEAIFDIASNPEFLREGTAVHDFLNPDRIIIGVENERARDILLKIYENFQDKILVTNIDTAELIKHASNSFLALKISFINLMANICEKTEADIEQVALGMGLDPRIGREFLRAGIGYGGSCFPKDIKALTKIGEELGVEMGLLREADKINQDRIRLFLEKVRRALWVLKEKRIAVLGLSFKPNTDDIREAPSLKIIGELRREVALVQLYDPKAMDNMKQVFPEEPPYLVYHPTLYDAVKDANALLILTEWDEFRQMDLLRIKNLMANPIIIDGRNLFEPSEIRKLGFEYYCIGRR